MSEYFPKPYECLVKNIKVELDLSNCATKANLEKHASQFAKKICLAILKSDVDELDIDKLKTSC